MSPLSDIVPVDAVLRRTHTLLEGPRIAAGGELLYSDVLSGGVYLHTRSGEIHELVPRRRGVGGVVEHVDGGVVVGGRDLIHSRGRAPDRLLLSGDDVTGFNDVSTAAEGDVLVGALRYRPLSGDRPVPGQLLRVAGPGRAETLSESLVWPNGIGLSPDGRRLYVSDFAREHVKTMAVDGTGEAVFCESPRGSADGLAVDIEGGVWIALGHGGGIARFDAGGTLDQIIDIPAAFVSSLSFGGHDGRDVVISTADNKLDPQTGGTLFVARSDVAGLPIARAAA